MKRVFAVAGAIALLLITAGALLLLFITGTDHGREAARKVALRILNGAVHGRVSIARIEGNLLGRFTLTDVAITDSAGVPFLSAARVGVTLDARALWSKRVALSSVSLERPLIHLSRRPDGPWNVARIFPSSEPDTDTLPGFGSWIALRDVTIADGVLVVQQPFSTDEKLTGAARDSVVAAVLAGRERARVDRADYGLRQTMDFTDIDAHLADVLVATPDSAGIWLRVDTLAMVAAPFHAPTFVVRQLAAAVHIGDDSVTLQRVVLRLPDTRARGSLAYVMASGDILASLMIDTLAFADLRGAYTPLPATGGGRMELQAAIRTASPSEFVAREMRLHAGTADVTGTLGIALSDSATRLDATDVRFTRVQTSFIESMVPGFKSPVSAEFSGRARVDGPLTAMQSDIQATIAVGRTSPFRMTARGELGVGDFVTARRLRISGDGIPVALAREFDVDVPVGGTLHVEATVSGSSASTFRGTASITHREAGNISHVTAEGSVGATSTAPMQLDVRVDSLALALAKHWLSDSTDVRGALTGTARVTGTARDLATELHLRLPGDGTIDGDVRYKLPGDTVPILGAALTFGAVNMQAVMPSLPRTALQGSTTFDTRGLALATMNATFAASLGPGTVDTVEFVEMTVRGTAEDGLLNIDTLHVGTSFAFATANGTFGLTGGKQGALRFRGDVPDLQQLAQWLPAGDTSVVTPRPARAVRLERRASRADSLRLGQLAEQDPAALLAADLQGVEVKRTPRAPGPAALRRDVLAGSFTATGQVEGNIVRATATADVQTSGLQVNGSQVGPGTITATWRHDSTAVDTIDVSGSIRLLQLEGFEFDSTRFRVRYVAGGTGDADVAMFVGDSATESSASYRVAAAYRLPEAEHDGEVRVRDLRLRMDSTTWRSTREGVVRWHGSDFTIDSLELRDAADSARGRIVVNGSVPASDAIQLALAWDSVRIAPLITLLQGDADADGFASGNLVVQGTRASPRLKGELALAQPTYNKSALPQVKAAIEYADRSLEVDAEAVRATGGRVARVSGTVPLDLSLTDSLETRFPDKEVALVVEGDSIPLSPLSLFTNQLTNVVGRANGRITVSGTTKRPHLTGEMSMVMDSARITYTGVGLTNVVARLHMIGDTLVLDTLSGRSGGTISGGGSIVVAELARPVMHLRLASTDAVVIDDERGKLFAETRITVEGPLDTLAVGGRITITRGVIRLPEPDTYDVINTNDPAIFAVVDTATARKLGLVTESSAMENLRLAIDLRVNRGTFARSADANVEIYGEVRIRLDSTTQGQFGLTGQLLTDYGDYRFMSKHFEVKRGSVRFTGGTELNPLLQIVATYEVPQTSRAPLEIRVNVGGTLEKPVVTLESDAQPALSNSDLISMLAFGRSTSSLLQSSSQSGGGQAGAPLTGNAAALSAQMLGSMAIDAIADKSTDDLTRITRADVVNITPGELPPDLSMGGFETLLKGTEIEIGRYLDRQTFLMARVRTTLVIPGATFERRLSERFRWRATFDTRFLQETPTLSTGIEPRTIQVIGSMFAWTFSW